MKRFLAALAITLAGAPAHAVIDGTCDFTQGTNSTQQLANGCAEEIGAILTTLTGLPGLYAPLSHVHAISDVTGLSAALAAKLDASAVSAFALTLLDDANAAAARTTLELGTAATSAASAFADAVHVHVAADVTDFASAVAALITGKADLASPTFTGTVALPAGQVINGVTLTTGGPSTEYLSADGTYTEPAGGGSDWVTVVLEADIITTASETAILSFTPPANSVIEIEAKMIVGTDTSGDAARVMVLWPSGVVRSAGWMDVVSGNTAIVGAATSAHAGGAFTQQSTTPNATYQQYLARFDGLMTTNGSPSGVFLVRLRAEVVGTTEYTAYAGSFLRYRVVNTSP